MLVVTKQGAFYLENLLTFTYMQTAQLISVYSVFYKAINQSEVVCKGFQPAPVNNTRKSHHPNPVSSLYCLSTSTPVVIIKGPGASERIQPAAEHIQSGYQIISNTTTQNYGENKSSSVGH
jgi:hypothetical protein